MRPVPTAYTATPNTSRHRYADTATLQQDSLPDFVFLKLYINMIKELLNGLGS